MPALLCTRDAARSGRTWAPSPLGDGPTYPVHYEGLAHVQPLLEKLGCDGHRIKVAEAPVARGERGKHGSHRSSHGSACSPVGFGVENARLPRPTPPTRQAPHGRRHAPRREIRSRSARQPHTAQHPGAVLPAHEVACVSRYCSSVHAQTCDTDAHSPPRVSFKRRRSPLTRDSRVTKNPLTSALPELPQKQGNLGGFVSGMRASNLQGPRRREAPAGEPAPGAASAHASKRPQQRLCALSWPVWVHAPGQPTA